MTEPVKDTVPQINHEVAVGADLEFQKRWWRFEHVLWWVFLALVVLDLLGAFGRGYLANAVVKSPDGSMNVKYERVERFRTPSIIQIKFSPEAVVNGEIKLWVSDVMIKPLGNQRIVPQPLRSELSDEGILYTFPSGPKPDTVEFALEPGSSGIYQINMHVLGRPGIEAKIVVVP
jgi:hypothetical protein